MTTALAIITAAHRESNLIPLGTAPSVTMVAEALPRLNSLLASVVGFEVGERLTDWPIGSVGVDRGLGSTSNSPPANVRLMVNDEQPHTIFMPYNPDNGARIGVVDGRGNFATHNITLNGNGRTVGGQFNHVLNTDGFTGEFIYREITGNWETTALLAEDDEMPYGIEHDDAFITLLAMRLNPRYGRAISAETKFALDRSLNQLRASHRQRRNVAVDDALLTGRGSRVDPYNPGDGY